MFDPVRLARALLALDGLSVGDAFGQHLLVDSATPAEVIARRLLPAAPWRHSDDTAMASVLVEQLAARGALDRDALALAFARRFADDPMRGYGAVAHWILSRIGAGEPWQTVARTPYGGTGSMGNGGAMRVAHVAAWLADDLATALREAESSAVVTHAHPEGVAGTLAVAAACVFACNTREVARPDERLAFAIAHTPDGRVREGLRRAADLLDATPEAAAQALGDGTQVTAPDTVPYSLWCAATSSGRYEEALWRSARGLTSEGADRDTVCAIVGSVVALTAGVPASWLAAREPLSVDAPAA